MERGGYRGCLATLGHPVGTAAGRDWPPEPRGEFWVPAEALTHSSLDIGVSPGHQGILGGVGKPHLRHARAPQCPRGPRSQASRSQGGRQRRGQHKSWGCCPDPVTQGRRGLEMAPWMGEGCLWKVSRGSGGAARTLRLACELRISPAPLDTQQGRRPTEELAWRDTH